MLDKTQSQYQNNNTNTSKTDSRMDSTHGHYGV
jgi:hypothetical protein